MIYRQCLLAQGTSRKVSWIPSEDARVGETVHLRTAGDWRIIEAWGESPLESIKAIETAVRRLRAEK